MATSRRLQSDSRVIIETLETLYSRRVDSTVLVDLRRQPRYDTQFPGEAIVADEDRASVTITNLSLSGLRFEAAEQNLARLLPITGPGGEHYPVTVTVCCAVPARYAQSGDIRVRCKTVSAYRWPHGGSQVGVRFTTVDEGREALAGYIAFREANR